MATSKVACAIAIVLGSLRGGLALNRARTSDIVQADKNRPISKVITLLKDMHKQLETEAEEDEAVFKKMACWCETNDREKTKAIAEAEARIQDLTTKIEEYTALSAQLATEIKTHEKEVAANQGALAQATALRQEQLEQFNAEEKDALESISALKAATTVLGKHQSLVQLSAVGSALRRALPRANFLTQEQRLAATSFLQQAPSAGSYAPASGQIFGILSQMLETFEKNLAQSQGEEQTNQKAYEDLKAAKEQEIAAGQAQIDAKEQTLAETDEKNAQAAEDLEDTKKSLAADQEFLAMLKEKCSMTDEEWEERQNTRRLEMEAVSKALEVLTGDDAHDLFTKTFNFLQVQLATSRDRREAAAKVLRDFPRLSALATSVKLDAFEKVKQAIDTMVAELAQEKQDEIKHKDFCVEEFNTNQLQTEKKTREQHESQASIDDLTMNIKGLTEAIDSLSAQIAEMQVQMKRAGEDRENQNKEFQATVSDQRETQRLLKAALTHLQGFYAKKAAFAQQEPVGPPPPAGFKEYKNNENSGGVMQLIETIAADAKAMENDAIRSESDAQTAYEIFVKESNTGIDAKTQDIVNKHEERAKAEIALVEQKKTLESVNAELEGLGNYKAELHQSCDFIIRNFDLRQSSRDEEIEALKKAKAILSGAKFD